MSVLGETANRMGLVKKFPVRPEPKFRWYIPDTKVSTNVPLDSDIVSESTVQQDWDDMITKMECVLHSIFESITDDNRYY